MATTDDAGRYLCNFIYWHSLCACSSRAEKEKEEEKKPLLLPSFLRRPMALLQQQQRKNGGEEEEGEKRREKAPAVVRHAVFVHLPPAEVLPVESQLEVVEREKNLEEEKERKKGGRRVFFVKFASCSLKKAFHSLLL